MQSNSIFRKKKLPFLHALLIVRFINLCHPLSYNAGYELQRGTGERKTELDQEKTHLNRAVVLLIKLKHFEGGQVLGLFENK